MNKNITFVTVCLHYLTIFGCIQCMVKIKEGFKGERFVSLPENLLAKYQHDPIIGNLYLRKIGYFPHVKYHYIQKDKGCDYSMLIYCTDGEGWYSIQGKKYILEKNSYIILPANTPYSFGANNDNPWTIYFMHFRGRSAKYYHCGSYQPQSVVPDDNSRLQDRLQLFEEIYQCFSLSYTIEYMRYTTACLGLFLASFLCLEQYNSIQTINNSKMSFSAKVIHYMQENIQHNISLEELATHFKYSPSHFSMLFQRETGVSPISYLLRLKIQKACQYIELTNLKLKDIALALGFEEASYFSRLFTKIMGIPPSEYKRKERG